MAESDLACGEPIFDFTLELDGTLREDPQPARRADHAPRYQNLSFGTSLGTQGAGGRGAFQMNDDRYRHTAVIGRTGSGKSNLVHQMECEDIRNGAGVFVLAAHEEDALYPDRGPICGVRGNGSPERTSVPN